ncbi:MAG: hypothetical protein JO104_02555 [Candidatus Eremiobacteraeota bacterium]|nr:hypothetical protein [Candidatus Eremiobacteraeota bacterium]
MVTSLATKLRRGVGLSAALGLLVACSNAGTGVAPTSAFKRPIGSPAGGPPAFALAQAPPRVPVRSGYRKSWMDPHATGPLLYISDSPVNVVLAYTWPKLRLIGNLSGLNYPQGECVDRSGNIWIANTKRSEMLEFARGSVKMIKRLKDRGQYPSGCSVSANGDLAVANIVARVGKGYGPGSLSIYKGAGGPPKVYSDPAFGRVFFDGYDGSGNVFLDGQDNNGAFLIAKFDGSTFTTLTVSGATINFPGAVQVTGSHVNVEDQLGSNGYSVMYETSLNGTTLTVDATAPLLDGMDCVQSYISGKGKRQRVICPDGVTPGIEVYKYTAGGSPVKALYRNVLSPTGAVVSP